MKRRGATAGRIAPHRRCEPFQRPKGPPSCPPRGVVQGQLYVCEAEHAIFFAKRPLMPRVLLRTHRDEAFIHDLADALERFDDQLEKMAEAAKRLGTFEQFSAQVVTPLDAERGLVSEEELASMLERDPGFDFDHRMSA
jgi:hypothetical protein